MNRKVLIIFAAATGAALALAILLFFFIPGGHIQLSTFLSAANTPEPLEDLIYVKNGALYYTSLDTPAPKEIVQYELPPQWRNVFAVQVSEDGRRFFYPKDIDNTKPNYCADIYCYDMTSKNSETVKIGADINNYTINQDGSRVFYLADKALYVSDLSKTNKIADEIDRFFINKKGDQSVYLTMDGRLFQYTGKNSSKELVSGVTLQYVSEDLNTIYYLKDNDLYLLKDGKDANMIDSGVVSVSNVYADGSLYYQKKNLINTLKSLYYYSNGQSTQITEYCDNVWGNEDRRVQKVINSGTSDCGSDRPLLVYSQRSADKTGVDTYVCSGSKVLGKIGDKKPARVEYDTVNNKIYYAADHGENQLLYDLYCAAIVGDTTCEVSKYAGDVYTNRILYGSNVVYIKGESNFDDGDLYVNNVKIDSFSYIWDWWTNISDSFTYAGNTSRYDHSYTLKLYKDGKVTKLANGVTRYIYSLYGNRIAYVVWNNKTDITGKLYLYDGSEASRQIDTEVNVIVVPLKNQYYSYWDDQPIYDIE